MKLMIMKMGDRMKMMEDEMKPYKMVKKEKPYKKKQKRESLEKDSISLNRSMFFSKEI